MTKKFLTGSALAALLAGGACTVHQTEAPALSGPSSFARSVTMTAIPDRITQDGASQSSVSALVIGPDGRPLSGISLRMDMLVAGQANDYGTLSARTVVTGSDGMARVVYTAPPAPPPPANTTISTVSIRATSIGADAVADSSVTTDIRLVPAGVILPPAGTPTAAFTMSPTAALANVPVTFDASNSTPGAGASSISSYAWNFGDGTAAGTGKSVTHTFTTQQTFTVTLTVTNDRGLSASTTTATAVGGLALPLPKFVFSPAAPAVGQVVLFNADQSTAAPGHTLTQFNWNFGDGATASGFLVSHTFAAAAGYNVVLAVLDDTGQKGTIAQSVAVTAAAGGGGGGATIASFVSSPTAPVVGQVVSFNASGSTAAGGRTLTKYAWDFGDLTTFTDTSPSTFHTFKTTGTFTVQLVVTDDTGQTAKVANAVTVATAGSILPAANFNLSPSPAVAGSQVVADASISTAGFGLSLVSYQWNFGDSTPILTCHAPLAGGDPAQCGATGRTVSHVWATTGNFSVSLVVTDSSGQQSAISKALTVGAVGGLVAGFTFNPANPAPAVDVSFNASASTGAIVRYQWTWGDGTAPTLTNVANPTLHRFAVAGTYTVTLTVFDNAGNSNTIAIAVVVQ